MADKNLPVIANFAVCRRAYWPSMARLRVICQPSAPIKAFLLPCTARWCWHPIQAASSPIDLGHSPVRRLGSVGNLGVTRSSEYLDQALWFYGVLALVGLPDGAICLSGV